MGATHDIEGQCIACDHAVVELHAFNRTYERTPFQTFEKEHVGWRFNGLDVVFIYPAIVFIV